MPAWGGVLGGARCYYSHILKHHPISPPLFHEQAALFFRPKELNQLSAISKDKEPPPELIRKADALSAAALRVRIDAGCVRLGMKEVQLEPWQLVSFRPRPTPPTRHAASDASTACSRVQRPAPCSRRLTCNSGTTI